MTDLFEHLKRLARGPRGRRGAHRTIAMAREHLSFTVERALATWRADEIRQWIDQ